MNEAYPGYSGQSRARKRKAPMNTPRGRTDSASGTRFPSTRPVCPRASRTCGRARTPLKVFRGNTAHSNDGDGLNVDHGPRPDGKTETTWYEPKSNPADEDSEDVVGVALRHP